MPENDIGGKKHQELRSTLRVVGPAIAILGLVLGIAGVTSLFSSAGSFEGPRYFWLAFIGFPLLAIGLTICQFAFLGAIGKYVAGEGAPVAKDTLNYLARETREGVSTTARAVGEGLARGAQAAAERQACPACGEPVEPGANFCDRCGRPVAQSRPCGACGTPNDADARFCKGCGKAM